MKLDPRLHHSQKLTPKWIKDLNVRTEIVKLLEENIKENLPGISLGKEVFGYDPQNTSNESTNQQMGLPQTKKLLHSERNNLIGEKVTYGMGEKD